MDFATQTFSSSQVDPPDSSTKECGVDYGSGVTFVIDNPPYQEVAVSDSGAPLPGVTNVFRADQWTAVTNFRAGSNQIITDKTYCARHYFKFSSGYATISHSNIKDTRFFEREGDGKVVPSLHTSWGQPNDVIHIEPYYSEGSLNESGIWCSGFSPPCNAGGISGTQTGPSAITRANCSNSWCSMETCFDHNEDGNHKLRTRVKIKRLADGSYTTWNTISTLGYSGTVYSGDELVAKSFITPISDGNGDPDAFDGQHIWYSHFLVAIKNVDPTFEIGAASEIEGGGGGAPPPGVSGSVKINGQMKVQ